MSQVKVQWVDVQDMNDNFRCFIEGQSVKVVELSALAEVVERAVDAEEEMPGEIPQEMYNTIVNGDKKLVAETLRIIVRATKKGIKQRLLAQLGDGK